MGTTWKSFMKLGMKVLHLFEGDIGYKCSETLVQALPVYK